MDTKCKIKHVIFKYDLDLKPKWLFHAFWTLSQWTALLSQVSWKCFKECARYEPDMKCRLKHLTFKCDLDQNCWLMPYAHDLSGLNIWAKFHEKPSKNVGDIEWTQNLALTLIHYLSLSVTLTFSQYSWHMPSAHHPSELNIYTKF